MTHPVLEHLPALERALVAKRFPRMTDWWRTTVTRFYQSGRRQLVLRVGRRGGKSSTLCRVAVLEALFGEHLVPPGDVGVVAILSVDRKEAARRVRMISKILDAIGEPYKPVDGGIELTRRPLAFQVMTASIAGVVGFTCICAICDEVARWRDSETGANPATEVLSGLRPTMADQPNAHLFLSSSPLGNVDAHAAAFDEGDAAHQLVAFAPTWVARPSLTEAKTHELEPDLRVWSREYAAIPQAGVLGAFEAGDIERALTRRPPGTVVGSPLVIVDPSSGERDLWTFGLAQWEHFTQPDPARDLRDDPLLWGDEGETLRQRLIARMPQPSEASDASAAPFLRIDPVVAIDAAEARELTMDGVVERVVAFARKHGAVGVRGDQRESFGLASAFRRWQLPYRSHPWTSANKPAAVELARRLFREAKLALPAGHERMRAELLAFEEKLTPTGLITFGGRASGDDHVALILTACIVMLEGAGLRPPREHTIGGRPGNAPARAPSLASGRYERDGGTVIISPAGYVRTGGSEISGNGNDF